MKKTYKTFNEKNRNCFFKVGEALVEVRFTPTYTTDNEFVQRAIEDSFSFKAGELQLVTPSMTWIKIDRDENGFATEECLDKIFEKTPVVFKTNIKGGTYEVANPSGKTISAVWREGIRTHNCYTHYLPIPKAPEE